MPEPLTAIPYEQGYVPMMIGHASMILEGEYDPNQYWLAFMTGAITKVPDQRHRMHRSTPPLARKLQSNPYARLCENGRVPYLYERDVPQIPLPFEEFRKMSKKDHSRCEQAHYPGWERENGKALIIPFDKALHKQVVDWCAANCEGRYHVKTERAYFQLKSDAAPVRMFFQRPKQADDDRWMR